MVTWIIIISTEKVIFTFISNLEILINYNSWTIFKTNQLLVPKVSKVSLKSKTFFFLFHKQEQVAEAKMTGILLPRATTHFL